MSTSRSLYTALASILLIRALWIASTAATPDGGATPGVADPRPFKPVARVSSLMAGIGSAFGNLSGALENEQEDRLDAVATRSEVIAELSNVNSRHRRKPDYVEMAADTRSIALQLARAARAEEADDAQLTMLLANLDNSCSTCHDAES